MKYDIKSFVEQHKDYWLTLPNVESVNIENNMIVIVVSKDVLCVANQINCEFLVRVKLKREPN